jgi:hypothetical protein
MIKKKNNEDTTEITEPKDETAFHKLYESG